MVMALGISSPPQPRKQYPQTTALLGALPGILCTGEKKNQPSLLCEKANEDQLLKTLL